jgi:hypothetical protein
MMLTPLVVWVTKVADQNQSGGHDRLGRAEPLPQGNDDFQTGLSQPHFFSLCFRQVADPVHRDCSHPWADSHTLGINVKITFGRAATKQRNAIRVNPRSSAVRRLSGSLRSLCLGGKSVLENQPLAKPANDMLEERAGISHGINDQGG